MNHLANLITISSLICGFVSIIFSLENDFTLASWAIILSVIFDGLDGQFARLNPQPSEFGKELDSLVDVISFGIAPCILGYIFLYQDKYFYLWAVPLLFIYLLCSVARLAKYNITLGETMADYFYGLPTTVSGGVLASFILIYRRSHNVLIARFVPVIFLFIVLSLSFLMVSRVRYLNLDGLKRVLGKRIKLTVFVLGILLVLAASLKKAGIATFTLFLIYLIFSPFVVKRLNHSQR